LLKLETHMIRRLLLAVMFMAVGGVMATRAEPAGNPDDDCDEMMSELKDVATDLLKVRSTATSPLAVCAAIGQLAGAAKISSAAADECYSDDRKRQQVVDSLDKLAKDYDAQIAQMCR
jgi:hypothetical protein